MELRALLQLNYSPRVRRLAHRGFDSRLRTLESGMAKNGHTSSQYPSAGHQGHSGPCLSPDGHPIHGIPQRKAESPWDRSDGPENSLN
jgi:hypothetical protein